jgi:hypothetical protein
MPPPLPDQVGGANLQQNPFIDSLQQGQNLSEFCNSLRRHTADL